MMESTDKKTQSGDTSSAMFYCGACCAPAGHAHTGGCPEATVDSAAKKAIAMLNTLDWTKLPLAVAGAAGVLQSVLGDRPAQQSGKCTSSAVCYCPDVHETPGAVPAVRPGLIGKGDGTMYEIDATAGVDGSKPGEAPLTFLQLRQANSLRLPLFKNGLGKPAHSEPDGSDWCPAQWLQALVGEIGEYARERINYELGLTPFDEYQKRASAELADVQGYLDLLARRALDKTVSAIRYDAASELQEFIARLGEYANYRKKFERGDISCISLETRGFNHLGLAMDQLRRVRQAAGGAPSCGVVVEAHPAGVDLGQATVTKFNEVSRRVGCEVFLPLAAAAAAPADEKGGA